jgi:DNA-3-methyladenine glycosylase II
MNSKVLTHFKSTDPAMHAALLLHKERILLEPSAPEEYFYRLCTEIISQQISVKAARAILARFNALFGDKLPTPEQVLAVTHEQYRSVGLSNAKANYVRNIAQAVHDGSLQFDNFDKMTDEEVIEQLVRIKGVGRWTAEMFLIFTMGREDVFSIGDLGLRKGFHKLYGCKREPKHSTILRISKKWAPYRTFASLALWRTLDNTPAV